MTARHSRSEVDRIVAALDTLVSSAIDDELTSREKAAGKPTFEFVAIVDLRAEDLPTRAQSEATWLIRDPIGTACRMGIRRLGEHLYRLGRTDLMGVVCERVADLDKSKWGYRIDILDKNWNSIGSGSERWLA